MHGLTLDTRIPPKPLSKAVHLMPAECETAAVCADPVRACAVCSHL